MKGINQSTLGEVLSLIDEERSISEIAKLSSNTYKTTYYILKELEKEGIIKTEQIPEKNKKIVSFNKKSEFYQEFISLRKNVINSWEKLNSKLKNPSIKKIYYKILEITSKKRFIDYNEIKKILCEKEKEDLSINELTEILFLMEKVGLIKTKIDITKLGRGQLKKMEEK